MGERGPKQSFTEVSCPNRSCKRFGMTSKGNIIANGTHEASCGEIRKFICKDCGRVFNSRTGTAYDGIRSSKERFDMCIELHNEGMSVRAIARTVGCSKDTVQRWTHSAAEQARGTASIFEKNLRPDALQMDELWSIVKKNQD